MDPNARPKPSIQLAAAQLGAYLDRPDLPDRVEMCCLQAAVELRRAGTVEAGNFPELPGPVELNQVLDTLHGLPMAAFDTDPVLNAVWHLNAAVDALAAA